ncbi:MAG: MFS transporter [Terracoccus sp.]
MSSPDDRGPAQPRARTGAGATRLVGRSLGRAATGSVRATTASGRYAATRVRAYTHAGGAGESGLARLTELHASHAAGDAAMMLALAGTLFFNPQTAQVRGQVAWFLLLTMVPFTLVAPFIGPLLDRFRHGRRWAIGTTMATRAFLCWVLAEAITHDSSWLYPTALLCLVASKAYTVARAAAVPRLLPDGTTLVRANSRVSMAGVLGAVVGGGLAGAALWAGPSWALRVAFVIFVVGTIQAIRLPARVDSALGEAGLEDTAPIPVHGQAAVAGAAHPAHPVRSRGGQVAADAEGAALEVDAAGLVGRWRRRMRAVPWPVRHAMWSTGGTRLLTGFLIMFMAFLAKEHPIDGVRGEVVLGLIVAGIGVGNAVGSVVGSRLRDLPPQRLAMLSVLGATLACVATALWYGIATLVLLGVVQGLSAQLSKLCFDALVQREVQEHVRASVFAWSETMLQVLWVVGGALGIILPLNPQIGFPVCAAALLGTVVLAARTRMPRGARSAVARVAP